MENTVPQTLFVISKRVKNCELRLWQAVSEEGKVGCKGSTTWHPSLCPILCPEGACWIQGCLLNVTGDILCQGQRRPAGGYRGSREGEFKEEKIWGRQETDCSRGMWVCRDTKNSFRYKISNSRESENMAPMVSLVSLQEVGEKKMMATLSAIIDITSHPLRLPMCPGQLSVFQAVP